MSPVGILTGLPSEARILERAGAGFGPKPIIVCAQASAAIAARELDSIARARPARLLSFGLAGGLDPSLPAGTIIVAERLIAPDGSTVPCDQAWLKIVADHLCAAGISARVGPIAGTEKCVAEPETKQELFHKTGALAVDMESHVLARSAAGRLPLLAIRAVADPADRTIPPAARASMTEEFGYRPERTVLALLRRPHDLPGVIRLARDSGKALAALRRVAASGAPFLDLT